MADNPCSATRQKRQTIDDGVLSSLEVFYQLEVVLSNSSEVIASFNSLCSNLTTAELDGSPTNTICIENVLSQSSRDRKLELHQLVENYKNLSYFCNISDL